MAQSKLGSFVEAWANIAVGFTLNWCINLATLPLLWDSANPKSSAFYIGLVFTVVSCVRQYVMRRWANRWSWSEAKHEPR